MTDQILHITTAAAWQDALEMGRYEPDSLSDEGFIHCSDSSQILRVANTFYRNQRGLILLVIDPARLTCKMKWEPPAEPRPAGVSSEERFPHLYGPLNLSAVVRTLGIEPDAGGEFHKVPDL